MSLSSIALLQREKELKAFRNYIAYNLIGSLVVHIGLFASGVGYYSLSKVPDLEENATELTFVDTPKEDLKTLPEAEIDDDSRILTSSNGGGNGGGGIQQQTQEQPATQERIRQNPVSKLTKSQPFQPLESFTGKLLPKAISTNRTESKTSVTTNQTSISENSVTANTTTTTSTTGNVNFSNVISGIRNFGGTVAGGNSSSTGGNGSISTGGSGTGTGTGNGTGTGTGNGNGNGAGNNNSNNNSIIATGPTTPRTESDLGNNRRNSSGSGDGRAACRECNTKYPEWARKGKVEGRVEVTVDTDAQGNITNVRLLRSSGNDRLDQEHLERARNWKLKPTSGGRNGVAIATEYAIEGSQRYRQLQERKRPRTESEANNSTPDNSSRRGRLVASTRNNITSDGSRETSRIRRPRDIAAVSSEQRPSRREQPTVSRRRKRESAFNTASSAPPRVNTRRKRPGFSLSPSVTTNNSGNSTSTGRRRRRKLPNAAPASESTN